MHNIYRLRRNGDLCTMEGRFQRHYLHAVPKEPSVKEARINLTWRWITKHNQAARPLRHTS